MEQARPSAVEEAIPADDDRAAEGVALAGAQQAAPDVPAPNLEAKDMAEEKIGLRLGARVKRNLQKDRTLGRNHSEEVSAR